LHSARVVAAPLSFGEGWGEDSKISDTILHSLREGAGG